MTSRVKKLLLTAFVLALIVSVPQLAQARTVCTASKPALSATPQAGTPFTVSGVIKRKSTTKSHSVVKIRLLMRMDGHYSVMDTYRATLHKNPAGSSGTKYACAITIPMEGEHAVRALHYRYGELVAKSRIAFFDVAPSTDVQQIAIDSDSHADVTAQAGTSIDVNFHSPSARMCGQTVHFLSPALAKTSSDPLTYHSDGLPAGSYAWQCNMGPGCCGGTLIIE